MWELGLHSLSKFGYSQLFMQPSNRGQPHSKDKESDNYLVRIHKRVRLIVILVSKVIGTF
jgi:hypothetical protein